MTDWNGAEYATLSGLQRTMITEAMAGLDFRPDDHVLDIGCGDGFLTAAIAALVPRGLVVGADPSHRMVATAAGSAAAGDVDPRFVVADVRALPFGETFDAAVSFNALHWVPEVRLALSQIAAVLKPGGSLLVQVVCAGTRPSLEGVTTTLSRQPRWVRWFEDLDPPFVHVDPDGYAALAASAGLVLDDLVATDRTWDFGSREAFHRWSAMGSTAWTDRLPAEHRERFVTEQVDAYEQVTGTAGLFAFMQMRARLHRGQTG
ncbi:methyltransferase domain-containing protein [Mycobacterium sp. NPDC006124]|uniref:class I SAM-dependent methyltransferase n=1 Tax=Mycobacterium sp. NPDC006124 TaxID=3156729 RepID=UPI00339F1317